ARYNDGQIGITCDECHCNTGEYRGQYKVASPFDDFKQSRHDDIKRAGFCDDSCESERTECDEYDAGHGLHAALCDELGDLLGNCIRIEAFFCYHRYIESCYRRSEYIRE